MGMMVSRNGRQPITEQYGNMVYDVKNSGLHVWGGQGLPVLIHFWISWKVWLVRAANRRAPFEHMV